MTKVAERKIIKEFYQAEGQASATCVVSTDDGKRYNPDISQVNYLSMTAICDFPGGQLKLSEMRAVELSDEKRGRFAVTFNVEAKRVPASYTKVPAFKFRK